LKKLFMVKFLLKVGEYVDQIGVRHDFR